MAAANAVGIRSAWGVAVTTAATVAGVSATVGRIRPSTTATSADRKGTDADLAEVALCQPGGHGDVVRVVPLEPMNNQAELGQTRVRVGGPVEELNDAVPSVGVQERCHLRRWSEYPVAKKDAVVRSLLASCPCVTGRTRIARRNHPAAVRWASRRTSVATRREERQNQRMRKTQPLHYRRYPL